MKQEKGDPRKEYTPPGLEPMGKAAGRIVENLFQEKEGAERRAGNAETLADHDHLTGLLNRRGFEGRASAEISLVSRRNMEARREGRSEAPHNMTFAVMDIDAFKKINDAHGHEVGDRALQAVARFLQEKFGRRSSDVISRGGEGSDEFWLLVTGDTEHVRERLGMEGAGGAGKVRVPNDIMVDGQPLELTLSAGLALCEPRDDESAEASIKRSLKEADALAYQAKRGQGR